MSLRRLSVVKTQSLRKLRVAVTLNESGRASASAILRVPATKTAGAVAFKLRSPRVRLAAGRTATLRLRRPARRVRGARRALAASGPRAAQIEVRLSDNAGNVRVVKRKVHVRP